MFSLGISLAGVGLFAKPFVVYSRMAETVGLLLAWVAQAQPEGWSGPACERLARAALSRKHAGAALHKSRGALTPRHPPFLLAEIYKAQIDSKVTAERGPVRFLVCAAAIASHHPAIVDRTIAAHALDALALTKGRLYSRGKILELIAQVLTAGIGGGGWPAADAAVSLGRGPLGTLLTARVSGRTRGRLVQFVALGLLSELLPHMAACELEHWCGPAHLPALFLGHPSSSCRGRFYDVAIRVWGLTDDAEAGRRCEALAPSAAALRTRLRGPLLAGLFDPSPDVRERVFGFWSDPARLHPGLSRRVLQLLTGMFDATELGARSWLHHAAPLVLSLAQTGPQATENASRVAVCALPLDRNAQFHALAVDRDGATATSSAALRPLFSQSAPEQQGGGAEAAGGGRVLATQAMAPRFSATAATQAGGGGGTGGRRPLAASFAPQAHSFGTFVAAMESKRRVAQAQASVWRTGALAGATFARATASQSQSFAAVATQFLRGGRAGGGGAAGTLADVGARGVRGSSTLAHGGAGTLAATGRPSDGVARLGADSLPAAAIGAVSVPRPLPAASLAPVPSFRVALLRSDYASRSQAAYKAQGLRVVAETRRRAAAASAVRLTRSYRRGELPDVQIAPLDIVRPLQQLCELVSRPGLTRGVMRVKRPML